MNGACIGSRNTYYKTLKDLDEWGFIKYERGTNRWKTPKFHLPCLYKSDHLLIPRPVPLPEHLPTHIIKLITESSKHVTENLPRWLDDLKLEDNTKPTLEEINAYCQSQGYVLDGQYIYNYYDELGWKDKNGNPICNWKIKLQTVWFKPEHRIKRTTVTAYEWHEPNN